MKARKATVGFEGVETEGQEHRGAGGRMRGLGWRERRGGGANDRGAGKTIGQGWRERERYVYIYRV